MTHNLKMKKLHVGWLFFIFVILYFTSDYWLPSKIDTIYKSEFESDQGSFVITIANPPLTKKDMLSFWSENKKYILDEIHGLDEGESILFVKNEFENKSKELKILYETISNKLNTWHTAINDFEILLNSIDQFIQYNQAFKYNQELTKLLELNSRYDSSRDIPENLRSLYTNFSTWMDNLNNEFYKSYAKVQSARSCKKRYCSYGKIIFSRIKNDS